MIGFELPLSGFPASIIYPGLESQRRGRKVLINDSRGLIGWKVLVVVEDMGRCDVCMHGDVEQMEVGIGGRRGCYGKGGSGSLLEES